MVSGGKEEGQYEKRPLLLPSLPLGYRSCSNGSWSVLTTKGPATVLACQLMPRPSAEDENAQAVCAARCLDARGKFGGRVRTSPAGGGAGVRFVRRSSQSPLSGRVCM